MAGSFVQNHTTGTSSTGTAVTATLAANVAAGNLLAVWVAMDNTGTTTPTVSSIDKPGGESATWARVASHDSSTATSAGGVRGELWVIKTTVLWASGTVITATLSASPPKSHMLCQEHTGVLATLRGTAGTSTSTTGAVSAATSGTALAAGDLVIGGATFETSATPTGDADTTNGSWSTALTGNTGGGASAAQVSSILQHKYVTATGVQTYNPTAGSADSGAAVAALQFDPAVIVAVATIVAVAAVPAVTLAENATATPATVAGVAAVGAVSTGGGGAAPTIRIGTFTAVTVAGTSYVLNVPAGVQSGEPMLASITLNSHASFIAGQEFGASDSGVPAGWTKIYSPASQSITANNFSLHVFQHTAGASEPSTYTWTAAQAVTGSGSIASGAGADAAAFDPAAALTVSVFDAGSTVGGNLTTTQAGDLIISFCGIDSSSTVVTVPTNLTEAWGASGAVGQRNAAAYRQNSPAATHTISWTIATAGLARAMWAAGLKAAAAGGDATATPAALAGVAAVGAPTVTVGVQVAPAAVVAVAAVGAPTVTVGVQVAPAAIVGVAAVPAPAVGGSATATPAAIATVAAVGAPTVTVATTASPATIAAVAAVGAPTVTVAGVRSPATVVGVAAMPAAAAGASQSATATPATIATVARIGETKRLWLFAATIGTITGLQPSTTYQVTIRAVDTSGNKSADSTPITVTTVAPDSTATPATIATVATIPAPTVTVSTSRQPATITAAAGVGAPTVTVATTVIPATIVGVAALPAPSVGGSASISPATITATVAVGTPTVQVAATRQPATITTVAAVGAPTITVGGTRTPATISGVAAVGAPSVGGGGGTQPATITATATVGAPTVTGGQSATVTPARILTVAAIGAVVAGAGAAATPATITVAAAIGAATVKYGATVAAATIVAVVAFPPIGPMIPPPRWVEHASVASGIVEGAAVASGIVEGSSSL